MNSKVIVSAILAMSVSTAGVAFAQGYGNGNDRGGNDRAQRGGQQDRRGNQRAQQDQRQYQGRASNARGPQGRGAGPNHDFRRGERLPAEYRNRQYVVDDWRGHHLSAPPRGYHWVQTGADYVLVAIATGVIVQLLLNN